WPGSPGSASKQQGIDAVARAGIGPVTADLFAYILTESFNRTHWQLATFFSFTCLDLVLTSQRDFTGGNGGNGDIFERSWRVEVEGIFCCAKRRGKARKEVESRGLNLG